MGLVCFNNCLKNLSVFRNQAIVTAYYNDFVDIQDLDESLSVTNVADFHQVDLGSGGGEVVVI